MRSPRRSFTVTGVPSSREACRRSCRRPFTKLDYDDTLNAAVACRDCSTFSADNPLTVTGVPSSREDGRRSSRYRSCSKPLASSLSRGMQYCRAYAMYLRQRNIPERLSRSSRLFNLSMHDLMRFCSSSLLCGMQYCRDVPAGAQLE